LQQFLERLDNVNSSPDYVYRVESAVLFGSMPSEAELLGDVDIAIELLPKRRYAAREQGKSFRSSFDWIF
jgi:predicted nucleotidyltransferase